MCDTFATRFKLNGKTTTWFGKNSDREPNESHEVVFVAGGPQVEGTICKCTYIEIPQSPITYDVILAKPVWMWGAEMGINKNGVVIGNEAVFTKRGINKEPALTGMDLVRLGLERSITAYSALNEMIGLLEKFGQGGNCGYSHPFYYNNSFLIADRNETWILETVGRNWAAKRFAESAAISNGLSIGTDWNLSSEQVTKGMDFAKNNSDKIMTHFSQAYDRRQCVLEAISGFQPDNSINIAFRALRSHNDSLSFPTGSLNTITVCMHAGFGPIRINQTTGSMVVELSDDSSIIWVTGSSAPCFSVFQPVWFGQFTENTVISSESDWRAREVLHRQALFIPEDVISIYTQERDGLEYDFMQEIRRNTDFSETQFTYLSNVMQKRKQQFINIWIDRLKTSKKVDRPFHYRKAWDSFNNEGRFAIP
jgi:dipeptidase